MELPGSWEELKRNKPALIGLAGAGVLGLVVFLRRRNAGGGGGSAGTATSGTGSAGGVGTFNSTGTDIASFLGDFSDRLDTQLGGYISQLQSTNSAVQQAGTTTTRVTQGQWIKPLVEQIARYRPGFSETDLQNLNPGLDIWGIADAAGFVNNRAADQATVQDVFSQTAMINIPRPV